MRVGNGGRKINHGGVNASSAGPVGTTRAPPGPERSRQRRGEEVADRLIRTFEPRVVGGDINGADDAAHGAGAPNRPARAAVIRSSTAALRLP